MKRKTEKTAPLIIVKRIGRILALILLLCVFCYGALMLGLGLWEYRTMQNAKADYTAVPVRITELSSMEKDAWYAVTLEPVDAKAKDRLGITYTTVFRLKQRTGDILTMYYDPQSPQTRVVDFASGAALRLQGGCCCGISLAVLLLWLFLRRICKKRRPPAVIISQETPS